MKILFGINFFSPLLGGSVECAYQQAKALAERGHEVTIYTTNRGLDRSFIDSIPKVNIISFRRLVTIQRLSITPALITAAARTVRDFDIIHLHNPRTFQNIVLHHYARKYHVPYILQAHGSLKTPTRVQKRWLFDRLWGARLLKDAAKLIAITKVEAEEYADMGASPANIALLPNGIDVTEYSRLPERGAFRKKWGIAPDEKVVLFLSRLHQFKGLDILTEAFARVAAWRENVRLVIAGPDAGYLETLKQLITKLKLGNKVIVTGYLTKPDKFAAFVDADIFVLPSSYEAFPVAVVESMACGTPVIVSDRSGIAPEIENKAGMVVPYDSEPLAGAIFRLLDEGGMRRKFSENGIRLVRERFNWTTIAGDLESIYRDCLKSG